MNIYISSSWKNRDRVRALAVALRAQGHEVYDFTDPACRKAPKIPPEAFPEQFDASKHDYATYLATVPHWRQAVYGNLEALRRCDLCVLLLPCGADSHADWGVAVGLGRRSIVVGHPKSGERTPSHLWAERIFVDEAAALKWLAGESNKPVEFTVGKIPPGRYTSHGRRISSCVNLDHAPTCDGRYDGCKNSRNSR